MPTWKDIKHAPKESNDGSDYLGPWILARNKYETRVCRWTTEYPCTEGVWMYGYGPTDYIDTVLSFRPTEFILLEELG